MKINSINSNGVYGSYTLSNKTNMNSLAFGKQNNEIENDTVYIKDENTKQENGEKYNTQQVLEAVDRFLQLSAWGISVLTAITLLPKTNVDPDLKSAVIAASSTAAATSFSLGMNGIMKMHNDSSVSMKEIEELKKKVAALEFAKKLEESDNE